MALVGNLLGVIIARRLSLLTQHLDRSEEGFLNGDLEWTLIAQISQDSSIDARVHKAKSMKKVLSKGNPMKLAKYHLKHPLECKQTHGEAPLPGGFSPLNVLRDDFSPPFQRLKFRVMRLLWYARWREMERYLMLR